MFDMSGIDVPLLIKVLEVFATFAGAWVINRYIIRPLAHHHFNHMDMQSKLLFSRIFGILVYVVAVIITFSILDLAGPATALLGSLGVAGIVLGFALKDLLTDTLSGFMVYSDQPFKVGDTVELEGKVGKVKDITSRVTKIETFSGEMMTIPNAKVRTMTVINKTRTGPLLRTEVEISIDYASDIEKAQKLCLGSMKANPHVEKDPAPKALVTSLGESSVNMELRYWVNLKENNYFDTRSEVIIKAKKALEKAGITIPFPQVTVSKRK